MANRTVKEAKNVHGTNPQYLVEKIIRTRIYDSKFWKEQCFALTAELLVDKAMELRAIGGVYGGNTKPTQFLCLTLKMLQIQPEKDIVVEFIKNQEFKYVRALGAFYLRLTGTAVDCYKYLEPLYIDNRKLRRQSRSGQYEIVHMDVFIDELLRDDRVCDVILPRIQKRWILEENNELEPRVSVLDDLEGLAISDDEHPTENNQRNKSSEDDSKLDEKRPRMESPRKRDLRYSRSPDEMYHYDRSGEDRPRDYYAALERYQRERELARSGRHHHQEGKERLSDRDWERQHRDREYERDRDRERERDRDRERERDRDRERERDRDRERERNREREHERVREKERERERDQKMRHRDRDREHYASMMQKHERVHEREERHARDDRYHDSRDGHRSHDRRDRNERGDRRY